MIYGAIALYFTGVVYFNVCLVLLVRALNLKCGSLGVLQSSIT